MSIILIGGCFKFLFLSIVIVIVIFILLFVFNVVLFLVDKIFFFNISFIEFFLKLCLIFGFFLYIIFICV